MVKKNQSGAIFWATLIAIALLDQTTKWIIKAQIFQIPFHTNSGSLFGIWQGAALALSWFTVIVIGIVLFNYEHIINASKTVKLSTGLIVGGAIGNLIDRIIHQAVIDFITIGWWPSFNVADAAITSGVVLLIIATWKK